MSDKDKKQKPPIGVRDVMPFLSTPAGKKAEELNEEEFAARYGPPYGPCGQPCDCKKCLEYRKKLTEQGPSTPKKIPPIRRDEFDAEIEKILSMEPREEWRAAIRAQKCFVKCWHDEENHSFCSAMDCDLRTLCEMAWEAVRGGVILRDDEDEIIPHANYQMYQIKSPRGIFDRRKGASRISRSQWKGTGKYSRVPYVSQNRPIDLIAHDIWSFLGRPPALPVGWYYGASKTDDQEEKARLSFISAFSADLYISRYSSYHMYMHNGYHFIRIWVNAGNGGWVDCCERLAKLLLVDSRNMIEKTPISGARTKFRFFPYRVYLSKPISIERFKTAITCLKEFRHLVKDFG
jgi:hypothetical protein